MGAAAGMSLVITGGVQIAGAPSAVFLIGNVRYFGMLTLPVIVVILITVIAWASLSLTRFGRWSYAIGSNLFASRAAGINVGIHLLKIYALTGVLSALAGAFVYPDRNCRWSTRIRQDSKRTMSREEAAKDRRRLYAVEAISKRYGSVVALENVDFSVDTGEVVGLVGDNGAGKSTLVRILSGVLAPDSGRILLNGEGRSWGSPHEALEAGIETLYQASGIAPDLTVAANVFLGREILKKGPLGFFGFLANVEMQERARKQLERVGIAAPAPNLPVSKLSGGQRQAVAIGRAVAWAKKVILLDEPTNHLGVRQAAEVLDVIRQAREEGLAVVFISHTLPHVLELADRIVVLRLGRVVADQPTSTFTQETLVKAITGLK